MEIHVPKGKEDAMAKAFRRGRIQGELVAENFRPENIATHKSLPPVFGPFLQVAGAYADEWEEKAAMYGFISALATDINSLNKALFVAQSELRNIRDEYQ